MPKIPIMKSHKKRPPVGFLRAPAIWVVLMHQRTVFGPFSSEQEARGWAAVQVGTYHFPAPSGEVHFGSVSVMRLQAPTVGGSK